MGRPILKLDPPQHTIWQALSSQVLTENTNRPHLCCFLQALHCTWHKNVVLSTWSFVDCLIASRITKFHKMSISIIFEFQLFVLVLFSKLRSEVLFFSSFICLSFGGSDSVSGCFTERECSQLGSDVRTLPVVNDCNQFETSFSKKVWKNSSWIFWVYFLQATSTICI